MAALSGLLLVAAVALWRPLRPWRRVLVRARATRPERPVRLIPVLLIGVLFITVAGWLLAGDRGAVLPGLRADLNVIDYDRLTFGPARMARDLPAGARRLVQKAEGYDATFVAGVQIVDHDEFTGELPGRLIRGPRITSRV